MTFRNICKLIGMPVVMGLAGGLISFASTTFGALCTDSESAPPLEGAFVGNALLFSLATILFMLLCPSENNALSNALKPSGNPLKDFLKTELLALGVYGATIPAGIIGDLICYPDRDTAPNDVGEVAKSMTAGAIFSWLVSFGFIGLLYIIGNCSTKNSEETRSLNSDYAVMMP